MKVETLQKIVTSLGHSWEEREDCNENWNDGEPCYVIDCFTISKLNEPVMVRTIAGERDSGRKKWLVEVETYDHGDRDTPPSSDTMEMGEEDSLENAVYSVLTKLYENKLDALFEGESLAELYSEQDFFFETHS